MYPLVAIIRTANKQWVVDLCQLDTETSRHTGFPDRTAAVEWAMAKGAVCFDGHNRPLEGTRPFRVAWPDSDNYARLAGFFVPSPR